MAVISTFQGNSTITADLVETVWNDYINTIPTFLHAVTLRLEETDKSLVSGIGNFTVIIPSYFAGVYQRDNNVNNYPDLLYNSTTILLPWDGSMIKDNTQYLQTVDRALYISNTEYLMNFLSTPIMKVLLSYEFEFTKALQFRVFEEDYERYEINTSKWPTILSTLPKTYGAYTETPLSFEQKARFWYLSAYNVVVTRINQIIPLAFIPAVSELGGWAFEQCSQAARYLGLKRPKLACSTAIWNAISSEYAVASSTTSLINKHYDTPGTISNGYLTGYTLPGLQILYHETEWTQGIIFQIIDYQPRDANSFEITMQIMTSTANLPVDGLLSISAHIPFVSSIKRYTPAVDIYYQNTTENDFVFDNGNWFTFNSILDMDVESVEQFDVITLLVSAEQFTFQGSYGVVFPLAMIEQLRDSIVMLPWRSQDFNTTVTDANFRCVNTERVALHLSYLHDKANTYACTVRQHAVGGGIISTEKKVQPDNAEEKQLAKDIPMMLFENGDAREHYNSYTAQGIMTFAIIPQLGGQLMAWSAFPSEFPIPFDSLLQKTKFEKPTIKRKICLNHRLVSYHYPHDKNISKYKIPITAFDVELIEIIGKNHSEKNDPIIDAIKRGLPASSLKPATYEIYKNHFIKEVPKAKIKKGEEKINLK